MCNRKNAPNTEGLGRNLQIRRRLLAFLLVLVNPKDNFLYKRQSPSLQDFLCARIVFEVTR